MGITECVNKEGGELPVSHTGLQTIVQSHADPSLEAPGSATLWG